MRDHWLLSENLNFYEVRYLNDVGPITLYFIRDLVSGAVNI